MNIKIIFKTYLKILKIWQKHFRFPKNFCIQNRRKQFSKSYQTYPSICFLFSSFFKYKIIIKLLFVFIIKN